MDSGRRFMLAAHAARVLDPGQPAMRVNMIEIK